MTGTFNSTVQAEINGQSTAPIGATSTSSASGTMKTVSTTSAVASASGSKTSTSTSASATKTGAAGKVGVTGLTCLIGAAASLLGAMLL